MGLRLFGITLRSAEGFARITGPRSGIGMVMRAVPPLHLLVGLNAFPARRRYGNYTQASAPEKGGKEAFPPFLCHYCFYAVASRRHAPLSSGDVNRVKTHFPAFSCFPEEFDDQAA